MKPSSILFRLFISIFASVALYAQTTVQPINNGKLTNALDANGQNINSAAQLSFGTIAPAAPTSIIHLLPNGNPTTAAGGITFGPASDNINVYRSGSGQLTLRGNVTINGTLTSTGTPLGALNGVNVWTNGGSNTWNGPSTFAGALTLNSSALAINSTTVTYGTGAAAAMRTALGVQPSNITLTQISAITTPLTVNGMFYADGGGTLRLGTGSTLRDALGLGTANSPVFTGITLTGNFATAGGHTFSAANTTAGGITLSVGATSAHIYTPVAGTVTVDAPFTAAGAVTFGAAAHITGTLSMGATPDNANLYKSAANTLRTDGNLVVGGSLSIVGGGTLAVTGGGTGLSSIAPGNILYSSASNVLSPSAITTFGRTTLAAANAADFMANTLTPFSVGGGTGITKIKSPAVFAAYAWGSVGAATELTRTFTVTGITPADTPTVALGFSGSLGGKIIVKQAWVSAPDTVSISIYNADVSPFTPTAVDIRVQVTTF